MTLDGRSIVVSDGTTILEAARSCGVSIPTLCYNAELGPLDACTLCCVEAEGRAELIRACSTKVTEGLEIHTSSPKVLKARRDALSLLLSEHVGDCLGPCTGVCPAGVNIPGFIELLAQGHPEDALRLVQEQLPFPGVLGRICKRPCETVCFRRHVDEPVAICQLHRFLGDMRFSEHPEAPKIASRCGSRHRNRIAIIGAGPSGLTAAVSLLKAGYSCVVFDAREAPGGMLRYGIPRFRLPEDVLDRELKLLDDLGVEYRLNTRVNADHSLDGLTREFDAVLVAVGAQRAKSMNIRGESAQGVVTGLEFLGALRESSKNVVVGSKVVVIGGGDVAIDAARSARRLDCPEVNLCCLESEADMPADFRQVDEARAEGVIIRSQCGLSNINVHDGKVSGVELVRCSSVFDETGAFHPRFDPSEHIEIGCDTLVVAIGQEVDTQWTQRFSSAGLSLGRFGPGHPSDKVFFCADCLSSPSSAIEAVASGRRAAESIDCYLRGIGLDSIQKQYHHTMPRDVNFLHKIFQGIERVHRAVAPLLDKQKALQGFEEVEGGLDSAVVSEEVRRCLQCNCRKSPVCKLRSLSSELAIGEIDHRYGEPIYSVTYPHPLVRYEAHKCIRCLGCVELGERILGIRLMCREGRGDQLIIQPISDEFSRASKNDIKRIVVSCPVGALTFAQDRNSRVDPRLEE